MGDAERRAVLLDDRHHVVADVADLGETFRLRIGEQDGFEPWLFGLAVQREVDRGRQLAGLRHACKPEAELG